MKVVVITLLKIYKMFFSPVLETFFGKACRYETTCSEYAIFAVERHGLKKGSALATRRLLSCQPFSKSFLETKI